jgi:adenine phosphoribosyltransferase
MRPAAHILDLTWKVGIVLEKTYKINIVGLERDLPICKINDKLSIAAFVIFGDVEMTVKTAQALIQKIPDCDILISAEAKGIPLVYEMARQMSMKKYLVARKGEKLYMTNPYRVDVNSITTAHKQSLVIDRKEAEEINGKRVVIVDDVISTGESLKAVEELVKAAGGKVVAKAAILAEGDANERDDIIFLEKLPLFFND